MLDELQKICLHVCGLWDVRLLEFGGESDHIHLLIGMHPNIMPSRFVNNIKTVTSRLLRKQFNQALREFYWKPALWTRAYCLISAGGAPLAILKQYIEKQQRPEN